MENASIHGRQPERSIEGHYVARSHGRAMPRSLTHWLCFLLWLHNGQTWSAEIIAPLPATARPFIVNFSLPAEFTAEQALPELHVRSVVLSVNAHVLWRSDVHSPREFPVNRLNGWGNVHRAQQHSYRSAFVRFPTDRHAAIIASSAVRLLAVDNAEITVIYRFLRGAPVSFNIFNGTRYVQHARLEPHRQDNRFRELKISLDTEALFPNGFNPRLVYLNKHYRDGPSRKRAPVTVKGHTWSGEVPPYLSHAPWLDQSGSRRHIDHLPREFHEALFFNSQATFEAFTSKYKDVYATWLGDIKRLRYPRKRAWEFVRDRLNKNFHRNVEFIRSTYAGLTPKQYKVLDVMNLVHGYFRFGTFNTRLGKQTAVQVNDLGDSSEIANLVSTLLTLWEIPHRIIGYAWRFESHAWKSTLALGDFFAGHQLVQAAGLIVDGETNMAFHVGDNYQLTGIAPERRLSELIAEHRIYGFYNWFLKPEVRAEQLKRGVDGGIIAFFYYYYLYGTDQADSHQMSYLPPVRSQIIPRHISPSEQIHWNRKEITRSIAIDCRPEDERYIDHWISILDRGWNVYGYRGNTLPVATDVFNIGIFLSSLADFFTYEGLCTHSQAEPRDLIERILVLSEKLLSAPDVFAGEPYGWVKGAEFDAFQDGSVNHKRTKYVFQTSSALAAIYNALLALRADTTLSRAQKERANIIKAKAHKILNTWERHYVKSAPGKGHYWYSEHPHDNKVVINTTTAMSYVWLQRFLLDGNKEFLHRSLELYNEFLGHIDEDPLARNGLIWPYGVTSQVVQDSGHAAVDFRLIGALKRIGLAAELSTDEIETTTDHLTRHSALDRLRYLGGIEGPAHRHAFYGIMASIGEFLGWSPSPLLEKRLQGQIDKVLERLPRDMSIGNRLRLAKVIGTYLKRHATL